MPAGYALTDDELARLDDELAAVADVEEELAVDDSSVALAALAAPLSPESRHHVAVIDAALVRIDREDLDDAPGFKQLLALRERVAR